MDGQIKSYPGGGHPKGKGYMSKQKAERGTSGPAARAGFENARQDGV